MKRKWSLFSSHRNEINLKTKKWKKLRHSQRKIFTEKKDFELCQLQRALCACQSGRKRSGGDHQSQLNRVALQNPIIPSTDETESTKTFYFVLFVQLNYLVLTCCEHTNSLPFLTGSLALIYEISPNCRSENSNFDINEFDYTLQIASNLWRDEREREKNVFFRFGNGEERRESTTKRKTENGNDHEIEPCTKRTNAIWNDQKNNV